MTREIDTTWRFQCDGCTRVTPEEPTCKVCGVAFVFHGTPDGDAVLDAVMGVLISNNDLRLLIQGPPTPTDSVYLHAVAKELLRTRSLLTDALDLLRCYSEDSGEAGGEYSCGECGACQFAIKLRALMAMLRT